MGIGEISIGKSKYEEKNAFLCTTISPALPYALFDRSITNASEVEQFNGNVVFEGIIACAKAALENNIPVVLGNDVGCYWITQYDFWRELYYFHKYVGVSNSFALYTATSKSAKLLACHYCEEHKCIEPRCDSLKDAGSEYCALHRPSKKNKKTLIPKRKL